MRSAAPPRSRPEPRREVSDERHALAPIVPSHHRARRRRLAAVASAGRLRALAQPRGSASLRPNGYVRLDADGTITIWSKNPDMGQGVKTAFAMILAEEMDADWSRVQVLDAELNRALFGGQGSGGSGSMRDEWDLYRNAGAAIARDAGRTPPPNHGACREPNAAPNAAAVLHAASNRGSELRRARHGGVDPDRRRRSRPGSPPARSRCSARAWPAWTTRRSSPGARSTASTSRLPDMKFAAIAKCPVFGGRVARVDDARGAEGAGRATGGAHRRATTIPTFLHARRRRRRGLDVGGVQGPRCAPVQWDEGPYSDESTATLSAQFAELARAPGTTVRAVGDVEQALAGAARVVEAYYEFPFLSHATLEPHNCTADVRDGHCYITGPLQMQGSGAVVVAAAVGLPVDRVHIQVTRLGGGFGRRLHVGLCGGGRGRVEGNRRTGAGDRHARRRHAPRLLPSRRRAAAARRPRRQRPHRRVGLPHGEPLEERVSARHLAGVEHGDLRMVAGVSNDLGPDLELDLVPWHIPNVRLQFSEPRSGVATGAWRAPAHVSNAFAVETLLDEIAQLTGRNAVDLRLELYGNAGDAPHHRRRSDAVRPGSHGGGAAPGRRAWRLRPARRPRVVPGDWPRTSPSAPTARRSWSCRWIRRRREPGARPYA